MKEQSAVQNIKVWDWSIRIFHWALPVLIFLLWLTQRNNHMENHFLMGQLLMGLLVYRLVWGFIGTPAARFAAFTYGPLAFWQYIKSFFSQDKPAYLGHNPPGGWMVWVLLLAVGFQLLTGLFTSDDIFYFGPLYDSVARSTADWMSRWHHQFFDLLLVMIAVHVLAVLVYRFRGENLIKAMFTGRKSLKKQPVDCEQQLVGAFPWVRFLLAVGIALSSVIWVFHW